MKSTSYENDFVWDILTLYTNPINTYMSGQNKSWNDVHVHETRATLVCQMFKTATFYIC